jgi:hypothetical protein
VPPDPRPTPRFVAEPPQEGLPYGRWAERLAEAFTQALADLSDAPGDIGSVSEIVWYPDRGWHGRTYVPATAQSGGGYEVFGYVRYLTPTEGGEPSEVTAHADFTDQTAAENPEWRIDLCEEAIGRWRGEAGAAATITLVWGWPLVPGGAVATAELGETTVDQCTLSGDRFTLVAPDDYRYDLLEVKLWDARGRELATESLYEGEEEEG